MRPADTKGTSVCFTRPSNESKSQSACQDSSSGAIFLLNFEPAYGERLALRLRGLRHKVLIPDTNGKSLSELQDEELQHADFVIFDLSRVNHAIWSELRRICRFRKQDGLPLMLLCWSQIYRGPEFQLLVEKLGARLVYAR